LTDGTYFECGLRRRFEVVEGLSLTPAFSGNWLSHGYMTIFPAPVGEDACERGIGCLRLSLVAEYRPFVRDYLLAKAAGHYRLEVSDAHVDVVFYGGDSTTPTSTFRLR
jgi:hypothetical protein